MINIIVIRQSYEQREITEIIWITRDSNPANSMTKYTSNTALIYIIETNKVDIQVVAQVEQKGETDQKETKERDRLEDRELQ